MSLNVDWKGLSAEQFLKEYWQKKPLFIKNAVADIEHLLTGDDLAGLAVEEDIEARVIFQKPVGEYHLKRGPFADDYFFTLGDSHWTLLVQAVDQFLPELNQFLGEFNFIPNWRIDDIMVSFATPEGTVGAHFDQYDVFLIQGSGSRRWQLGQMCDEHTPLVANSEVKVLQQFDSQSSFDCEPGDLLYIPPGLAHYGVATSQHCMTYSVGSRAPSWRYMLEILLDDFLQTVPIQDLYKDPDLALQSAGLFESKEIIQSMKEKVGDYFNSDKAKSCLNELISEPKYEGYVAEVNESSFELYENMIIQRDLGSRFIFCENPFELFINGDQFEVADAEIELAKLICNAPVFGAESLQPFINSTLLQTLWQKGLLFEQ